MASKVFWADVRCDDYSPAGPPSGSSLRLMAYAAASFRLAESVLLRMLLRWLPLVLTLMDSSSAISRSILPRLGGPMGHPWKPRGSMLLLGFTNGDGNGVDRVGLVSLEVLGGQHGRSIVTR